MVHVDDVTTCPRCSSEVPTGWCWCAICHANVIDPAAARLASPVGASGRLFLDAVIPLLFLIVFLVLPLGFTAAGELRGSDAIFVAMTVGALALLTYVICCLWGFLLPRHPLRDHGACAFVGQN
ncbi:MAG: hypothetical protein ACREA0_19055 [bacterium]